jgi:hypothetical protein
MPSSNSQIVLAAAIDFLAITPIPLIGLFLKATLTVQLNYISHPMHQVASPVRVFLHWPKADVDLGWLAIFTWGSPAFAENIHNLNERLILTIRLQKRFSVGANRYAPGTPAAAR